MHRFNEKMNAIHVVCMCNLINATGLMYEIFQDAWKNPGCSNIYTPFKGPITPLAYLHVQQTVGAVFFYVLID